MGKQKNRNQAQNVSGKLKIRIGSKFPILKNIYSDELEIEENEDLEVNLEEEVVEHEENVVDTDMNIVFENNYEEVYKNNAVSDNDSEFEIETSQANSECIEEDEDEDEDDDENECPNDEDDDEEDYEKLKNLNKNSQYYNKKNQKYKPSKENIFQPKSKTNSNRVKSTYSKNTNSFENDYEDNEWLNDDEDVDYKKYKSSCGLTVRQRALFHGEKVEDLLELSTSQRVVELSEEQMMKRKRKALRRRQLAHEKDEKDKRSTLDKLLKKQDSKLKCPKTDPTGKSSSASSSSINLNKKVPYKVRITINQNGTSISIPKDWDFPLKKTTYPEIKSRVKCGVAGCGRDKIYNCSKTNVPLCSLQCYKKNLFSCPS